MTTAERAEPSVVAGEAEGVTVPASVGDGFGVSVGATGVKVTVRGSGVLVGARVGVDVGARVGVATGVGIGLHANKRRIKPPVKARRNLMAQCGQ